MIPKIIHQIWLGNKRIPKHIIEFMSEIKDKHPDYEYYLWIDTNIPELPYELKEVFDSLNHSAQKADLLRVYVLYLYGGICLDVDYKLLTHLDNLNCYDTKDAYVVYQKHTSVEDLYCSVQISSKKGNFITFMLNKINKKGMWLGPHWYAQCVYEYVGLKKYCHYADILDKCPQYNLGYIDWNKINSNVIRHDFMASWYPNSEWKKKLESNDYE